jgi:hypothetical protein
MPYIKSSDRSKFHPSIMSILDILKDPVDTPYIKGEYFGFFVNRLVKKFLIDPDYTLNTFNSIYFNEGKKKVLINVADSIGAMINRSDPIASAGDLNYAITSVLWGFMGDAEGHAVVGYGMRCYLRAIIDKIAQSIESVNSGSQKDVAMAFRRHLIAKGVLGDVVSETLRVKNGPYEDIKLDANGPIWQDGVLYVRPQTEMVKT